LPPWQETTAEGRLPDESGFPGDVIGVNGVWQRGRTIFDVVDDLREGDVILKGANALDLERRRAAVLIGHPAAEPLLPHCRPLWGGACDWSCRWAWRSVCAAI
jgi:hypothetical protein